jgi:hypothetical protein
MKLPENFWKVKDTGNSSVAKLAPYKVHLLGVHTMVETEDHHLFIPSGYESECLKSSDSLHMPEEVYKKWNNEYLYIPIVSFDGINVLLLENISEDKKKHLKFVKGEYEDKDMLIHFFSLNSVNPKMLSQDGLKQYANALEQMEEYSKLASIVNLIKK